MSDPAATPATSPSWTLDALARRPVETRELQTPDALWSTLDGLLNEPLPPDCVPIAVFDADETLWDCDVGEDLFHWFVREEKVHPDNVPAVCQFLDSLGFQTAGDGRAGLHRFLEAYEAHPLAGEDPIQLQLACYEFMVWCMAGHPVELLAEWAADRIPVLLPSRIFEVQRQWIQRLEARGIQCYIISASSIWSVRPGAALMGVPVSQVRAVGLAVQDGVALPTLLRPAPIDVGKVQVVRQLTAQKPMFGFGDSQFDVPMLRSVHFPVLVNQKKTALAAASRFPEVPWQRVRLTPIGAGQP